MVVMVLLHSNGLLQITFQTKPAQITKPEDGPMVLDAQLISNAEHAVQVVDVQFLTATTFTVLINMAQLVGNKP